MNKGIFFGRQAYLETLTRRVSGLKDGFRQNIAVLGDELVGKTSVIFKFLERFHDSRFILAYLETRPEPFASFARRFFGILLYNFLIQSGLPLEEELEFLLKKSERFIPRTVARIRSVLDSLQKKKKINAISDILSVLDELHAESSKYCVVIFDEFQNLENIGAKFIYRDWSKVILTQKSTMYIILSSNKHRARAILAKDLSLLFGNFEVINVEPFDIKESESYLVERFQESSLDRPLRDFLVNFTGGYPFYLQAISEAVCGLGRGGLDEILEGLLFETSGTLNQRFTGAVRRLTEINNSQDYISILYLVASGRNRIKDISHILKIQKKDLLSRVNRLLELDVLARSGDFLVISDRVFSFWLRFVYQGKLQSLTFDARSQKEFFRNSINSMIEDFIAASRKSLPERVNEVLRLFEDEVIQLERKKIKLNHFREIKPLAFSGKGIRDGLIGRSHDCLWIVAFKPGEVTESDIIEFVKECKKFRSKSQRKIIVSLKDIDPNTKLRAMEEKIWAWDVKRVNTIFDLYSKPRVI